MNLFTWSMLFYYFGKYLQMKNHKKNTWKKFQIKTSENDLRCNIFDFGLLSLQAYQIQGTA